MIAKQITFLSVVALIIGIVLWRAGKRALSKFKLAKATIVDHVFDENELTLIGGQQGFNNDESGTFYPCHSFSH